LALVADVTETHSLAFAVAASSEPAAFIGPRARLSELSSGSTLATDAVHRLLAMGRKQAGVTFVARLPTRPALALALYVAKQVAVTREAKAGVAIGAPLHERHSRLGEGIADTETLRQVPAVARVRSYCLHAGRKPFHPCVLEGWRARVSQDLHVAFAKEVLTDASD
jgi:hypothetical protein